MRRRCIFHSAAKLLPVPAGPSMHTSVSAALVSSAAPPRKAGTASRVSRALLSFACAMAVATDIKALFLVGGHVGAETSNGLRQAKHALRRRTRHLHDDRPHEDIGIRPPHVEAIGFRPQHVHPDKHLRRPRSPLLPYA